MSLFIVSASALAGCKDKGNNNSSDIQFTDTETSHIKDTDDKDDSSSSKGKDKDKEKNSSNKGTQSNKNSSDKNGSNNSDGKPVNSSSTNTNNSSNNNSVSSGNTNNTPNSNGVPAVNTFSTSTYNSQTIKRAGAYSVAYLKKGVYNKGNQALIVNAMKKAMRGEEITIAVFGGSITYGADSAGAAAISNTCDTRNYGQQVADWWTEAFKFYGCKVKLVNAGIGATDTPYSIHRMQEDVLVHNPDLIIIEWDMNDDTSTSKQGTYESMVRTILSKNIALMMMSFSGTRSEGSFSMHSEIAKHYQVPYISYTKAFKSNTNWAKLTGDGTHPNRVGHTLAAALINYYLGTIYDDIDTITDKAVALPSTTVNAEAKYYDGAYTARLSDIAEGKIQGARIVSYGSFTKDVATTKMAYKEFYGYTAKSNSSGVYEPLVIEVDNCKTAFIHMAKVRNLFSDGSYKVSIDGVNVEDVGKTFNCSAGVSSEDKQTESTYMWCSKRLCYNPSGKKVTITITPTLKSTESKAYVKLFALLLS